MDAAAPDDASSLTRLLTRTKRLLNACVNVYSSECKRLYGYLSSGLFGRAMCTVGWGIGDN